MARLSVKAISEVTRDEFVIMQCITRSNSYTFACADPGISGEQASQPLTSEALRFGDRVLKKVELDEWGIKCGYGRIGNPVGHGVFGCVHDFYLDRAGGSQPAPPDVEQWVFKAEFPHEQNSFEAKNRSFKQYPLTKNGWLHGTLRSIASYQVALTLGIDNVVETHLGFADNTPGALMRKVQGETVADWLVRRGFYEREGLSQDYSKEELSRLIHSRDPADRERVKQILWNAFETAVDETGLGDDWAQLKCVDFITGQADRKKLSNMMICIQQGRLRLMGIDNDLSFPVNNDRIAMAAPYKSSVISPVKNPGLCERLVSVLHPEALEAFRERVAVAQALWFMDKEEGEVNMKLGPEADVAPEGFGSESGAEGLRESSPVAGAPPNLVFFEEGSYQPQAASQRHCTIL